MRGPRPQTPMLALSAALAFASSASSLLMPNPGSRKALLQPVMGHDAPNFADPSILTVDNVIYSFATSTEGVNVPVSCQSEGGGMELMRSPPSKSAAFEALPTLPKWSSGAVWAPDVIQLVSCNPNPPNFVAFRTLTLCRRTGVLSCTSPPHSLRRRNPSTALERPHHRTSQGRTNHKTAPSLAP